LNHLYWGIGFVRPALAVRRPETPLHVLAALETFPDVIRQCETDDCRVAVGPAARRYSVHDEEVYILSIASKRIT